MQGISGKVALVTGGASKIGRASALRFGEAGATVAVAETTLDGAQETAATIEAAGGHAIAYEANVAVEGDWERLVERVVADHGRIDLFHNNSELDAELAVTDGGTVDWDGAVNVCLKGVFFGLKHVAPEMQANSGGCIVNTASVADITGPGDARAVATKHGVVGFSKVAAVAYGDDGIRVNAVCPGIVDTRVIRRSVSTDGGPIGELVGADPLTLMGEAFEEETQEITRMGDPSEIAESVVWLCSDEAAFVTGYPLVVHGTTPID
jgi:NAD(P)-dependent dehydrogenase (short-subunit alcohol dehydrogenase family)